ncbi:MAG: ATP adenylyltransferase [Cyanobium sp.]
MRDSRPVRAERFWQSAREVSDQALAQGALVPLSTRVIRGEEFEPFLLRELTGLPPRHLRESGPRANPFLPWDRPLEVGRLGEGHVVLLHKSPVQQAHLLVITTEWQPQNGWLRLLDWQAVARLAADTGGLWFFNSSATAGASQPHRHLQLLPRTREERTCPLAPRLIAQLEGREAAWPWAYRLSRRRDPLGGEDLPELYRSHCQELDIGCPDDSPLPRQAYNLLFDDTWFLTVRREREHQAGFSINGLGFAGYLLSTVRSDREWLRKEGPWALLQAVATPDSVFPRLRQVG